MFRPAADNCGGMAGCFHLRCLEARAYRDEHETDTSSLRQMQKDSGSKTLLSENELWAVLNKGDEIEVMHLADDVHHTWKLTGQDKDNLRKARAAGKA